MACPDCAKGSLDEGTPRGEVITLGGVPCYFSKPTANGNGRAIIIGTDVFGWELINARLIADAFSDQGYCCVVPDYFKGQPFNLQVLETFESLPSRSFFSKIGAVLWLVTQVAGLNRFIKRNPYPYAMDVVTAVAAALRDEYAIDKIGLQGYCYGGTLGILMAAKPDVVDAVCVAHPGPVEMPGAITAIQSPILFICAERDNTFGDKPRTKALQLMEQHHPGLGSFILYPKTTHGFAVRGSKHDPAVNAARQDALQQAMRFFSQHLLGVPVPEPLVEGAAPVGKRLQLAPLAC